MQEELKREKWINAIRRKEECRTDEEFDFEVLSEVLFEDDEYIFFKECIDSYTFRKKGVGGMSSEFDFFLESKMSAILKDDSYGDMTFLEFMEQRGFPITFKTWDD